MRRNLTRFIYMSTLILLLSPAPASAQTTAKEKQQALHAVYNNISMGAAPIWVTHRMGIFQKHGLDVTLSFARGTLSTQAMVAGSFPVGIVSPPGVVSSNLAGARLKIVAGLINKMLYALVTTREITSAAQLKGKRIGISRFGDSSEMATRLVAKELGLNPDRELTMIQVGSGPDRYASLRAGSIHGAMVGPAEVIRARREGFNVMVDLVPRNIDYQGSVVAMSEDFIRNNEATALNFVRAVTEGLYYFRTKREESVQVAASYLRTTNVETLRESWQVYAERIFPAKPYPSIQGMELVIREVASQNPAAQNATPEQFIDLRFIEQIDRSGFIDRLYR